MDSRHRLLTLGIPWAHSMPSWDVNAAARLAEGDWRRTKTENCAGKENKKAAIELFLIFIVYVGRFPVVLC